MTWQTKLVPVRRWNLITSHTLIPHNASTQAQRAAVIITWANKAIYLYHFTARKKAKRFHSHRLHVTFICFSLFRDWRSFHARIDFGGEVAFFFSLTFVGWITRKLSEKSNIHKTVATDGAQGKITFTQLNQANHESRTHNDSSRRSKISPTWAHQTVFWWLMCLKSKRGDCRRARFLFADLSGTRHELISIKNVHLKRLLFMMTLFITECDEWIFK